MPSLHGVCRQPEQGFDPREQFTCESDFLRAVHLGLDDVDRPRARIADAVRAVALEVVDGDGGRDHRVEDAFGNFLAAAVQDGRIGHEVADVAHEQQRAAVQRDLAAGSLRAGAETRLVLAVRVQAAGERLAALGDLLRQRALQDAQPVAVRQHLVLRIHHGHRVLEVQDGGQRRFDAHVGDAGGVGLADRRLAVDLDVDVDAVVAQQHGGGCRRVALEADELGGVLQSAGGSVLQDHGELAAFDPVAGRVLVRAGRQRRGTVEEIARERDHLGAAPRVVALALFGAAGFGDHVRAVQRVVERAPARIRGVERITGVEDRHHELRAGLQREFGIHVGGRRFGARGRWHQVADLFQEAAVGGHVRDRAGMRLVPLVELGLQAVALGEQGNVPGRQVGDDRVEAFPEGGAVHAGAGQHLVLDEAVQLGGHFQAVDPCSGSHVVVLKVVNQKKASTSRRLVPVRVGCVPSSSKGS